CSHPGPRRCARLVEELRGRLASEYDLSLSICGIATGRHGSTWGSGGLDTSASARRIDEGRSIGDCGGGSPAADSLDVIRRLAGSGADLRIVVETTTLEIAGAGTAIGHVRAAIDGGCHVVTANKGPVAFAYADLRRRAEAAGVSFLFEGAVMDGIPIFNLVRETLPAVEIVGFRGVINSTTNHILSALEDGESFDAALQRMQAEGIAEADPSLDVDGWDAAAKTSALANVLMRARMTPQAVEREGIGPSTARVAMAAKARGMRVRLIASARQSPGGVVTSVRPVELPETDLLAGLRGMANAIVLQTDL